MIDNLLWCIVDSLRLTFEPSTSLRQRLTDRASTFDSLEEEVRRIMDDLEEDKAMNKAPTPEKAKEIAEVRFTNLTTILA